MHALSEQFPTSFASATPRPTTLYADDRERSRHLEYIERLAQEVDCPVQMIEPLYEQTLARLKSGATVQDYLPILTAKGVKKALKEIIKRH